VRQCGQVPAPALLSFLLIAAACTNGGLPPGSPAADRCRNVREVSAGASSVDTPGFDGAARVRWTVFGDSADRAVLDAWCAGVGPALIQHAPRSSAADGQGDGAAAGEVVFVSWNIARGEGELHRLIAELRAGRHTSGRPVSAFVLLLQEAPRMGADVPPQAALPDGVATSSARQLQGPGIPEVAAAAGLHLFYVPSMRAAPNDIGPVDHGTAILSSLPLREPHVIELPMGIQRRVAAVVTISLPGAGTDVSVATAHLDNFSFRRPVGSLGAIRARQAAALDRALPRDGALVLGADLNTWMRELREPAFTLLRRRLPEPASPGRTPTSRFLGVPRRVDHLLARAPASHAFTGRRLADRYGSDHHPLIGVLKPLGNSQLR
jgi:endonuclease/exonuclease/phosphatase family metal-dependent hydrolase